MSVEPVSESNLVIPEVVEEAKEEAPAIETKENTPEETLEKVMAEEKVRLAQIAREAKNVAIGKQLKALTTQISEEGGENYALWGDTFMSILQNTDKIAYQVNKEAFHEVIDLLIAPPLETRALPYFNTLYEVATRLLTLDPFKALGIVKEYLLATRRIPALIQRARIAMDEGKTNEALSLLDKAKDLIPFHTTRNPITKNSYLEEQKAFIQEIASLEKEIDPKRAYETLNAFTNRQTHSTSYMLMALLLSLGFALGYFTSKGGK